VFFGRLSLTAERGIRSFGDCSLLSGTGKSESGNQFIIGGKQQCHPYEDQKGAPSAKACKGSNSGAGNNGHSKNRMVTHPEKGDRAAFSGRR
jgi:hypothetical protein